MSNMTERFSEVNAVLAELDPGVYGAGEQNSGYVSFANYRRGMVIIQTGAMSALVTVEFEEATDAAGTGAQGFNLGGKDLNLATPGYVYLFEIKSEEFTQAAGTYYDHLNVELVLTDNVELSMLVLGTVPRFPPVDVTLVTVTD